MAASKPTSPLSVADDAFQFDIWPTLWGLNLSLGCSPLGLGAYPLGPVSRGLRRRWIRSLKEKRNLSAPYFPISALPHRLPRSRLVCKLLRRELAITGLDWSLAPIPKSGERIARQHPFEPPPSFRLASPCSGIDRPVSSLATMTPCPFRPSASPAQSWLRALRFPYASVLLTLKLAMIANSPARVSRRN